MAPLAPPVPMPMIIPSNHCSPADVSNFIFTFFPNASGHVFGLNSISSLLLQFLLPKTECVELPVKFVTQSGGPNCAETSDGP